MPSMRVLEIGPDAYPSTYQKVVGDPSIVWETLDMHADPRLTWHAESEYRFPVPDDTYDIVLSGQVIEHVKRIWVWMKELARVCKPGGEVLTINPVSWPYHRAPVDCWRIYPEGMRALYEEAGIEVVFSTWNSLETPFIRKRIPGRSLDYRKKTSQVVYGFLGLIGFPVECAYDTITIGRKPLPGSAQGGTSGTAA